LRLLACTLLALVTAGASAADVYRWVDADGNVTYSDRPQNDRAERVPVLAPRAASRPAALPAQPQPAAAPSVQEPAQPEPQQAAEPTPEQRARNCEVARERVTRYAEARRLYRTTADGERQYLSDAEIDEARARAAADVEAWCN